MERSFKIEIRVAGFLGVTFVCFLPITPELGMFLLGVFVNPSSILDWNPWYYPFGFISVVSFLLLSSFSYKFNLETAKYIWMGQAVFSGLWIFSKLLIFKQELLFLAWYVLCAVGSIFVSYYLHAHIDDGAEIT
jgi:hypothetical protein